MRLFEIVIFAANLLAVFGLMWAGRPRWWSFLPALALVAILPHLLIEKYRWQMVPLYVLTVLLVLLISLPALRGYAFRSQPVWAVLGSLLVLLATTLPFLFPVPSMTTPTGPYRIGTTLFYWTDTAREEIYNEPPGGLRRLVVQAWYPANPAPGARTGPYLPNLEIAGPALARELDLPEFFLNHINLARTHSYPEAPAAAGGPFPVLVFSHGWTGFRAQNTYQMEELASQGYIVFSADHTYAASVTVFEDSSVALTNRAALSPSGTPDDEYDRVARRLGQTFVADIRFVLDQAEAVQSGEIPGPLTGQLDLSRVGIFGHSTGAGAAVEACHGDPRCKAGLTEDAWLIPYDRAIPRQGLSKPFLFLQSEAWAARRNAPLFAQLFQNSRAERYRVMIRGSAHYDFTDVPLLTPLASLIDLKGPINGRRMLSITNAYTLAFFDQYLKGQPAPLLSGPPAAYPEVEYEALR